MLQTVLNCEKLEQAFNFFANGENDLKHKSITARQLKKIFTGRVDPIDLAVYEGIVAEVKCEKDGQIQFKDFKKMMDGLVQ
jgi:Ca2+-binding EF-hand superfamily protein